MRLARLPRLLLVGPPGSGKGTQAARLQRHLRLAAIASGDLLRQHLRTNTADARAAAAAIARGGLVDDALVLRLVTAALAAARHQGWLLDGFPRTPEQAAALDAHLAAAATTTSPQHRLNLVVHLSVPDAVILDRIQSRWIHPASGRVYNLGYNPPRTPFCDDVTGEPLVRRADDTVEVFAERLRVYRAQVDRLLAFYDAQPGVDVWHFEGATSDSIYAQLQQKLVAWGAVLDAPDDAQDTHERHDAVRSAV